MSDSASQLGGSSSFQRVLAVDPGRQKCGLAIGEGGTIAKRMIVRTGVLVETVGIWAREYAPELIILGNRTGANDLYRHLTARIRGVPVVLVEEAGTTLEARRRYFQEHPPRRGWRRLLPLSIQRPPEPYDDYVAVLLIERYWAGLVEDPRRKNFTETS